MSDDDLGYEPDKLGPWSEAKHTILSKYAEAYAKILNKNRLPYVYIDGFAGSGEALRKGTDERVPGSPLLALRVQPPFFEYHFVEYDGAKAAALANRVAGRENATVYHGDANEILLHTILPTMLWGTKRRALCLLDPYGLHLRWEVIAQAGKLKTIDMLLNFPTMDMNRKVLTKRDSAIPNEEAKRLTAFWGDESWLDVAYEPPDMYGERHKRPNANALMVDAFCERLVEKAGFACVSNSCPMRNNEGIVLYYLVFASQKDVAVRIMDQTFALHG